MEKPEPSQPPAIGNQPDSAPTNPEVPILPDGTIPPLPSSAIPEKHKKGRKKLIILLVVLLLVVAGVGGYLYLKSKKSTSSANTAAKNSQAQAKNSLFTPVKQANGDVKVADRTWYATPISKPITAYTVFPIDVLRCQQDCGSEGPYDIYSFWQVGKTDDGQDIVVANPGTIDSVPFMFLSKDGKNIVLKQYSSGLFSADSGKLIYDGYGTNTTLDSTTSYPELNAPDTLTLNGKQFYLESKGGLPLLDTNKPQSPTAYASTDYGAVNLETKNIDADANGTYSAQRYLLQLYNFNPVYYQPTPNVPDLMAGDIAYSDGTSNKSTYGSGFHGCTLGGSFYDVMSDKNATYTQAGSYTKGSVNLYVLSDQANAPIIKNLYSDYQNIAGGPTDAYYPSLTMAQFLDKKPILFFKNSLGAYMALYNNDTEPGGGCGKPVIYLYPQKAENVQVKVDADIRISQPNYTDGWNVYAKPSGQLTVNGKNYGSLYWEGYGRYYPDVTSGTIVAKAQLASTLKQQLAQLGLNAKESQDFMGFWLPKMPSTPYVRLTWFGTSQVNKIAPMKIIPAPDTLIRVFLDFEGLNTPQNLPAQHLNHLPRKGFTVVEWGGLLHTPLPKK
ncbi:MAG TPA: hypothetical protein VMT23_01230 [Candidatus Binatia bacterium]|nr:hypothetical protein [Candidatus Binatia bacterium]